MTAEQLTAYDQATRPYLDGKSFITEELFKRRSWRYLIEFNTACNLKCIFCMNGNRCKGYQSTPGVMSDEVMRKVLDKVATENPKAHIMPYGNSEPFLHPKYHEVIAAIKAHGFTCEIATNLHFTENIEATVALNPEFFIISVSGFTQEIYSRSHRGGDIERVKKNMQLLAEIKSRVNPKLLVVVDYHRYKYNLHEIEPMRVFCNNLGFSFMTVSGRVITLENAVQYLRNIETQSIAPYEKGPGELDLNRDFPEPPVEFVEQFEQLEFHPRGIPGLYKDYPVASVCPIADLFTYIRHDGRVQLCAWTDDTRLVLGNYLDMTLEQITEARLNHPLCRECLSYHLNLYFHLVDYPKWSPIDTFEKK